MDIQTLDYGSLVSQIVNTLNIEHLLDFACGDGAPLKDSLTPNHRFTYQAYDPRIPDLSGYPVPAQMVCCLGYLDGVASADDALDTIEELAQEVVFISITGDMERWFPKLASRFRTQTLQRVNDKEFYFIGNALG